MTTTQEQGHTGQIIEQSIEQLLAPYVNFPTFGIDIAAGLIIGISAITG